MQTATDNAGMMYLSGTSMAAPIVSGAAAMLFQARPDITPGMAKAILMYTAQPIEWRKHFRTRRGIVKYQRCDRSFEFIKIQRFIFE